MCGPVSTRRYGTMLLTLAALTNACATPGGSETERAICRELRAALPTWQVQDTAQSKDDGARFMAAFEAACRRGRGGRSRFTARSTPDCRIGRKAVIRYGYE
jgi:hypothetical protein